MEGALFAFMIIWAGLGLTMVRQEYENEKSKIYKMAFWDSLKILFQAACCGPFTRKLVLAKFNR